MADVQFTPEEIKRLQAAAAANKSSSSSSGSTEFTPEETQRLEAASNSDKQSKFTQVNSLMPQLAPAAGAVEGLVHSALGMNAFLAKILGLKGEAANTNKIGQSFDKKFNSIVPQSGGRTAGEVVGETIPFVLAPEESLIGKGVSAAPKILTSGPVRKAIFKAAARLPSGALIGGSTYDPSGKNTAENAGIGAAINAALPPVAGAAAAVIQPRKNLAKVISFFTKKSAQEMKDNPSELVGDVVGSPWLKRLETNTLPTVAASGYAKKVQDIFNNLLDKAGGVYKKLTTNGGKRVSKEDSDKNIVDAMDKYYDHLIDQFAGKYQDIWDEADKRGVKTNLSSYFQKAQDLLSKHEESKLLGGISSNEPMISDLNNIKDAAERNKSRGGMTMSQAHFIKSDLGKLLRAAQKQPNPAAISVFGDLQDAVEKDMGQSLKDAGQNDLFDEYKKVQKEFKDNIVPLRDGIMTSIRNGTRDTDSIIDYFLPKNGKNKVNRIKLLKKAAPGAEKDVLNSYFENAVNTNFLGNRSLDLQKFHKLLSDLGYKRLKALSPSDDFKGIQNFMDSYDKDQDVFVNFKNLPTGFSNIASDNAKRSAEHLINAVMHPGSAPSSLAKAVAAPAFGKALSSPSMIPDIISAKEGNEIAPISQIIKRLVSMAAIQQSAGSGGSK